MNINYSVIDEIKNIIIKEKLKGDVPKWFPNEKRLLDFFNRPTKKTIDFNKKLIKQGKIFRYLYKDTLYNPTTKRFFKPKLDKRYKEPTFIKKFKNAEKLGSILVDNSLEVQTDGAYQIDIDLQIRDLGTNLVNLYQEYLNNPSEELKNEIKILESTEITVDLTKINWATIIDIIGQNEVYNDTTKVSCIGRPINSNNWITFSSSNITRLKDIQNIFGNQYAEQQGSDNQFLFDISQNPKFVLKFFVRDLSKETDNGAFFKYYHLLNNIDLSILGIYNKKPKSYADNCLYIALKHQDLELEKLNSMKEFVKSGSVPITKLKNIAKKLNICIVLKRNEKDLIYYGNKEDKQYKINLIDNHYFIDCKIDITSYALKNYDEIKDIKDYHKINKKKGKYFEKSNKHQINSFRVVNYLLENKDKLLKSIPILDIMATPYYNNMIDNNDLEYDPKTCSKINECIKTDNKEAHRIFFDFETDTSRKDEEEKPTKHVPYLMCALDQNNKNFVAYGEECGKDFINNIKNQFTKEKVMEDVSKFDIGKVKDVMLIAHNCRYDFTFIMDFFSQFGLRPILNGTRLMGGSARIYINNHEDRHICNKKCKNKCEMKNKILVKGKWISPFIKIILQDSYNLISKPLRDFSNMFKLNSQKEILPYDLYNTKNIFDKYISINECLSFVKYEDKEEYLLNAKNWGCIVNNKIDIIKYSKIYCDMDCKVLKDGYDTFRIWIKEVCDLDIINYCSIASLSMDYLIKKGCFSTEIKEQEISLDELYKLEKYNCYKLAGRPRDFIQKCVVGGRTMCRNNKKWRVEGRINDFDAVSLYPSAMYRMKGFLKGLPKVIKKENLNLDWLKNNTDGFFIKVMALNNCSQLTHGVLAGKFLNFPLLSNTENDGVRNFTNETKGNIYYLDKTMIEDAIEYQNIEFDIICGYYYDEGHNNKINGVMKHLFNTRLEAKKKGNPIQEIYKLLMNSSYGKSLLKPIETDIAIVPNSKFDAYLNKNYNYIRQITDLKDSKIIKETKIIDDHFNNCYAGVEVLSMSKHIMNEVMCLAEEKDLKIYYQDTDSMHIDDKDIKILTKEFKNKYNRDLIGKGMGQFHSDFDMGKAKNIVATKSIFLGKKSYFDKLEGDLDGKIIDGEHTRMKGINFEGIQHYAKLKGCTIEDIYDRLYDDDKLWKDVNNGAFDLLAGGSKVKFKYNNDMSVKSCNSFFRSVNFKYDKGILT